MERILLCLWDKKNFKYFIKLNLLENKKDNEY